MDYRLLGRSGLKVSALAMGTATFGGTESWGGTTLPDAQRQIDLCLDHGVNLLDTADVYSGGESEEFLGAALGDGRRNRVLLASKVRHSTAQGPNDRGLSRWHIIQTCEASLRRMKTDVIDLYQVMPGTARPRSRKRSRRSTRWCGRARFATSAARAIPPGT